MHFKALFVSVAAVCITACTSVQVGPNKLTTEDKNNQQMALQNIMCAFEPHPEGKQSPCAHLIEHRLLLGRFFAPIRPAGMNESEQNRGRRITTKFIVEAAAKIKQCRKVSLENTINVIRDVKIAGSSYLVKGTSPLLQESSSCFLTPNLEGS